MFIFYFFYRFMNHYFFCFSLLLFSCLSSAYNGLELGHNQTYAPVDSSQKIHHMKDLYAACMLATATYNYHYQRTAPHCGMEATGEAGYSPAYGIHCMAINYCIINGVRNNYLPAAGYIGLNKANCLGIDSQGNCITAPKPENDCAANPNCDTPECPVGNPIYPSSGKKIQKEVDLVINDQFDLSVIRTYKHYPKPANQNVILARGHWNFDLDQRKLEFSFDYSAGSTFHQVNPQICADLKISNCVNHYDITEVKNYKTISAVRPDGKEWNFRSLLNENNPTNWSTHYFPYATINPVYDANQTVAGWVIKLSDGSTESYSIDGKLLQINTSNGMPTTITRYLDVDGITNVTQATNGSNTLKFYKDSSDRIIRVSTNNNQIMNYEYVGSSSIVRKVIFHDGSSKTYLYENAQFPQALTGIEDERGIRYATWKYDSLGRAISSEHAGVTEKTSLDYSNIYAAVSPRVTVTNALGKKTTYYYSTDGLRNVIRVEGQPTANCVGANQDYTYTPEGWIASKTDWKGIKTTFTYNTAGQEISRTEAFATPEARTITTEWHPTLFVKTKVTEPEKETIYSYDANGRLLNQIIHAL